MSGRSEADIRKQLQDEQNKIAKLLNAGKDKEAMQMLLEASKKGISDLLDLDYQGKKVKDVSEFKEAKTLTDKLIKKVWDVYWGKAPFPLKALMDFCDEDYMISLYQGMDVAGIYNDSSKGMDPRLKTWFVLGFYAFEYEFAAKPLLSYAKVLNKKNYTKAGVAANLLKSKYRIAETQEYFEPFLRNAIDHSSYIVTDMAAGKIDAWNVKDGRITPKKQYQVMVIFKMTVRLLFFITAYFASWYELVIDLDKKGTLHNK